MKNLLLITIVLFLFSTCTTPTQDEYTIKGSVSGLSDEQVLLQTRQGGVWITMDSVRASQGNFEMSGKVVMPAMMYLRFKGVSGSVPVFMENAAISVAGSIDSLDRLRITGSASHNEYTAYTRSKDVLYQKYEDLSEQYRLADSAGNEEQ